MKLKKHEKEKQELRMKRVGFRRNTAKSPQKKNL